MKPPASDEDIEAIKKVFVGRPEALYKLMQEGNGSYLVDNEIVFRDPDGELWEETVSGIQAVSMFLELYMDKSVFWYPEDDAKDGELAEATTDYHDNFWEQDFPFASCDDNPSYWMLRPVEGRWEVAFKYNDAAYEEGISTGMSIEEFAAAIEYLDLEEPAALCWSFEETVSIARQKHAQQKLGMAGYAKYAILALRKLPALPTTGQLIEVAEIAYYAQMRLAVLGYDPGFKPFVDDIHGFIMEFPDSRYEPTDPKDVGRLSEILSALEESLLPLFQRWS